MTSYSISSLLPSSMRKNKVVVVESSDTEEKLKTSSINEVMGEGQQRVKDELPELVEITAAASAIISSMSFATSTQERVVDEPIVPFPPISSSDAASTDSSNTPPDSSQEFMAISQDDVRSNKEQKKRYPFSNFFSSFTSNKTESGDSLDSDTVPESCNSKGREFRTTESVTAEQTSEMDGACIVPELVGNSITPPVSKVQK